MFGEADADDLVATWAEGLGRFDASDLKRALETMVVAYPDFPPTLPQFAGMCRDAMRARVQITGRVEYVRYGAPSPEILAEIHRVSLSADRQKDKRDWARKILRREADGEKLPAMAVSIAREALGVE